MVAGFKGLVDSGLHAIDLAEVGSGNKVHSMDRACNQSLDRLEVGRHQTHEVAEHGAASDIGQQAFLGLAFECSKVRVDECRKVFQKLPCAASARRYDLAQSRCDLEHLWNVAHRFVD